MTVRSECIMHREGRMEEEEGEKEDALTVKDVFFHPIWLHDIVQHLLGSCPPHSFVTGGFIGELFFNGVFRVELLEVEERIHPSLSKLEL